MPHPGPCLVVGLCRFSEQTADCTRKEPGLFLRGGCRCLRHLRYRCRCPPGSRQRRGYIGCLPGASGRSGQLVAVPGLPDSITRFPIAFCLLKGTTLTTHTLLAALPAAVEASSHSISSTINGPDRGPLTTVLCVGVSCQWGENTTRARRHAPHHARAISVNAAVPSSRRLMRQYSSVWCAMCGSPGPRMSVGGRP